MKVFQIFLRIKKKEKKDNCLTKLLYINLNLNKSENIRLLISDRYKSKLDYNNL